VLDQVLAHNFSVSQTPSYQLLKASVLQQQKEYAEAEAMLSA
jgi:hypothetical protein